MLTEFFDNKAASVLRAEGALMKYWEFSAKHARKAKMKGFVMPGWNVPKRHLTKKSRSKPAKLSRPVFAEHCSMSADSSLQKKQPKRVLTFLDEKKTFNIFDCDFTILRSR
jgi:hypothetical protein